MKKLLAMFLALAMVLSSAWYCDSACFCHTLCLPGRTDHVTCHPGMLLLADEFSSGRADSSDPGCSHLHQTLGELCPHL